ncbi:hypothetical protein B1745_06990 [Lactobacillus amylolyticus]|uniref:Uncharacterized protein n=1 Tax=Lactobacillus helveticus TaxID=1587 RepID=A0A8H9KHE8_LACHE|nr:MULTISPECIES: hypothetical protein [Lactobacillus]ARD07335.1 hypothetical protein B1745_06990 [Lactobacillus amylolyticus]KRO09520.1 hypothetical protein IV62_GL001821 [Lactobacillus helveticus]MBW8062236.1 hypothetical protein [Lactobacillus helveticus]GFO99438.1 hypothetical protein LHEH8_11940 [Lactobacillus helveticus]GFP01601.1 hypothetical protein LHEW6_14340 [Lactobacillus helveticus]
MKFQKLIAGAILLTGSLAVLSVVPQSVSATSTESTPVAVVKNKASFTKEGYIMRILNDKDASKIYVGKSNYKKLVKNITPSKKAKTISPKKVQKVKFRIEKVLNVKGRGAGAPVYLVASKDKKYSSWTTQSGLQYYYLNSKAMKNVKKPLMRIANRLNTSLKKANNKRDFNAAMKAAKKLHGNQRKFVLRFLKQLKKDGSMNVGGTNLLIFGLQ